MLKVLQFDLVERNAEIAERPLETACKRNEISSQLWLIGKISVTVLNLALAETGAVRSNCLQAVGDYRVA